MSKGVKVGDIGTAHDGFPETPILSGSPDVKFDGQPAARVGDPLLPHSKPKHPPHPRTISSGSSTVFINGKPAAITGGEISCGGITIGSGTVNIGDKYQPPTSSPLSKLESGESKKITTARTNSANSQTSLPIRIPSDSGYWPAYNPLVEDDDKYLNVEYVEPIKSFALMSPEEAHEFLQNLYADMGGKETIGDVKTYRGLGSGVYDAYKTASGLGGLGVVAYTKSINGKDWVIIKNFRRYEQTLMKGNKWGANNLRVIKVGLGLNDLKGAARFVRFNVGLEIIVSVGINTADYILRDEATLAEFVGNSAGDIVKGMATLAGAALITATFVPATASLLVVGIVFTVSSFIVGKQLDHVDEKNGYSEDFTIAVQDYFNDNF